MRLVHSGSASLECVGARSADEQFHKETLQRHQIKTGIVLFESRGVEGGLLGFYLAFMEHNGSFQKSLREE